MIHIFFWALLKKKCIFTDAPSALLVRFYEKYYRIILTKVYYLYTNIIIK